MALPFALGAAYLGLCVVLFLVRRVLVFPAPRDRVDAGRRWRRSGGSFAAVEYPGYPGAPGTPLGRKHPDSGREGPRAPHRVDGDCTHARRPQRPVARHGGGSASPSQRDVAARGIFRVFPVRLLIRDRFDSEGLAPRIDRPVPVLHGNQDEVVPFDLGRALSVLWQHPPTASEYLDFVAR